MSNATVLMGISVSLLLFCDQMDSDDIALDEHLDKKDPLRHLMNDNELEGIISAEGLSRASSSTSELLDVLPQQSHSIQDGILNLSFVNDPHNSVSISLAVDASPGCGGLAWPAGQVRCLPIYRRTTKRRL